MTKEQETKTLGLLRTLSAYREKNRHEKPVCTFCGADMQDNIDNFPANPSPSGGGVDPEHLRDCPVVRARILLSQIESQTRQ